MNYKIENSSIKIPSDISVVYSQTKKTLIFVGPLKKKSIRLALIVFVNKSKKTINVSSFAFSKSNLKRNKIKSFKNTCVAQLKHLLIESSITIYRKLKTVGVGFRVTSSEALNKRLITLKLGYSHLIFIKIPEQLTLKCTTKTTFCIFGNSHTAVHYFSAFIRSYKLPEPYKGKGILYEEEFVKLKEGKKI